MSAAVETLAPRTLSIISPWKDFWFFFASGFVVLIALAANRMRVDGMIVLGAVAVVSNGPHLVSSWTRVYLDRREWRAKPFALFAVPALILFSVFWLNFKMGETGSRILNSAILYWATWHFVAQNWGILRIYQRKSGESESSIAMRLEKPIMFLTVAWCLAYRIYTGPRTMLGVEILYVKPPFALVMGALVPLAAMVAVYAAQRVRERNAPHAKAAWIRMGFLAVTSMAFFVPFELIRSDDTTAFAAAACWHGFQYLGIVRHYHRNTWRGGVSREAPLISWLSQPGRGRALAYWGMLPLLCGMVYAVIFAVSLWTNRKYAYNFFDIAAPVWGGLSLSHYWLDGVIWKLRRPELAARVGITDAAAA